MLPILHLGLGSTMLGVTGDKEFCPVWSLPLRFLLVVLQGSHANRSARFPIFRVELQ